MSALEQRALTLAYELSRVLGEISERQGEGSCAAYAWDQLEDVIGLLEPDEPERPRLRLVVREQVRP